MSGETWRSVFAAGVESSYGSAATRTRTQYYSIDDSFLSREQDARFHRFAVGNRQTVRALTLGPQRAGGTLVQPLSASEIVEWLLITIQGAVTPATGSTGKLWTFTPGDTLDSATLEWNDGANVWVGAGYYGNRLRIAGNPNGENVATLETFGASCVTGTAVTGLNEATPDFVSGWETAFYADAFGATAGASQVTGTLVNWDVAIDNQLGRKYFADNTNATGKVTIGEIGIAADLVLEASAAAAISEFDNWINGTKRLIRLAFGQNVGVGGSSDKYFVTVDIPGGWEMFNLGRTDAGTRVYGARLQYVYDTQNDYGLQIRCQNARTSAWGNR